jgi:hypothetical protein
VPQYNGHPPPPPPGHNLRYHNLNDQVSTQDNKLQVRRMMVKKKVNDAMKNMIKVKLNVDLSEEMNEEKNIYFAGHCVIVK